jgi:hypothetical protein
MKKKRSHLRKRWKAASARWREKNPCTYLFANHKNNARRRGKVVLWDLEEFIEWCAFTGHHIMAREGYEIHRFGDVGPYCAANCMSLPGGFNKRLEAGFAWRRKWVAERENYLQTLKQKTA